MTDARKQFICLSRSQAIEFESDVPWACISITDPEAERPKIGLVKCLGMLKLDFWDSDLPREGGDYFNESQADDILQFVKDKWEQVDVFMLHCLAGQCRSPGVAAAISKIYYGDDMDFFKSPFTPNMRVYSTILKRAHERGEYENEK